MLSGKSGTTYKGIIYSDKNSTTSISGRAIVCLSNSHSSEGGWQHAIRDIYDTDNTTKILQHFRERDDISHLILIPKEETSGPTDKIDDLRRQYIHS